MKDALIRLIQMALADKNTPTEFQEALQYSHGFYITVEEAEGLLTGTSDDVDALMGNLI